MIDNAGAAPDLKTPVPAITRLRRRRSARLANVGWVVGLAWAFLGLSILVAILTPLVLHTPLSQVNLSQSMRPPVWAGGSFTHILGTDQLGRDMLQRLGYGIGNSLIVGVASAVAGCIVGSVIGVLSGYLGSWVDAVLSRLVDAQLAFPVILIGLALSVFLRPSLWTVVVAIALTSWPMYARVVRSETLVLKESEFVALAKVSGLRSGKIMMRHILPNVLPSVIVLASQNFGLAVINESALSYLGIGVQAPQTSLGLMIADAQQFLISQPLLVIEPTLVLTILCLSANIIGDSLRERFDPTLRTVS
jgi:peptide/nickel transport system permease protein